MLWYKGRHKRPTGWQTRSVHMTLAPEDWRTIEESCVITEDTVGYTISQIMHDWALARRAEQDRIDGMAKEWRPDRVDLDTTAKALGLE